MNVDWKSLIRDTVEPGTLSPRLPMPEGAVVVRSDRWPQATCDGFPKTVRGLLWGWRKTRQANRERVVVHMVRDPKGRMIVRLAAWTHRDVPARSAGMQPLVSLGGEPCSRQ